MRGQRGERFRELEVVSELGARLLPALADPGDQPAPRPHLLAQFADQVGVLGEPLDQDGPRAVQGGGRVGHAALRIDVLGGGRLRAGLRVGQQQVGQRFQPGLAGDLGFGPPLRLVGQVDVLEPGLGVGGHDPRGELVVELALGPDGLQDGPPPLLQLAQVTQPLLERAQLRVVQGAGHLLAVAGDERHRGPAVEQPDRRADLPLAHPQFLGDPALDSGVGGRLLGAGDLEEIVADYAEDAVFISPAGVLHGQGGIRTAFTQLLADVPNADWTLKTQIYEGDVLFLEWAADAGATYADDGIDTFVLSATRCSTGADHPGGLAARARGNWVPMRDSAPRAGWA